MRRGTATVPDLLLPSAIQEAPPPGPPRRLASPSPPPAHVKQLLPPSGPPPTPPHRPCVLPRGGASFLAPLPGLGACRKICACAQGSASATCSCGWSQSPSWRLGLEPGTWRRLKVHFYQELRPTQLPQRF